MTSTEYNIVAFLALIPPTIFTLSVNRDRRSILGFLIIYGISFLIILLIFELVKNIL